MIMFGTAAFVLLSWAVMAPASFGRHLAEIANAYEAKRSKLPGNQEDRRDGVEHNAMPEGRA